jgi:uncharacterized protein (TIGR03435 family)
MIRLLPFLLTGLLFAQTPAAKHEFEAASVKPLVDTSLADLLRTNYRAVTISDSRVDLRGQTLPELIARAWSVPGDRVTKIPESVLGLFFDVSARIPSGVSKGAVPEMLQALLIERFRLAAHTDEEVRPMYVMTVSKTTSKLQPSTADGPGKCVVEGEHRMCRAMTMAEFASTLSSIGQIGRAAANSPAPNAAQIMEWIIDRPVEDKTGLEGKFDFPFDYNRVGKQPADTPPVRVADAVAALGLKLDSVKQSVRTVVVEHVEKSPTEN